MKLLTKYYDTVSGKVLPYENFTLFRDLLCNVSPALGFALAPVSEADRAAVIAYAEERLEKPYPETLASDYIRFYRDGNRTIFEGKYFERRQMAVNFALAEAFEGKGRFISRVLDGAMLICDEYDWVLPAHIGRQYAISPWYRNEHPYIDLFAAETGATLASIYLLAKPALDKVTPMACDRLLFTLHDRIIAPFLEQDMYWMGLDNRPVNNWNPWILSNILYVCAVIEPDTLTRERVVARVVKCLDNFIAGYHSDGGCDEGPSYWTVAGGSLFDTLELLYDMTGGYIDIFGEELIRRMGEYEADFHINASYYIDFADCPPRVNPSYRMLARFGRRTGSKRLEAFGAFYAHKLGQTNGVGRQTLYRYLKNLFDLLPEGAAYLPSPQGWYDGITVMTEREVIDSVVADDKGFFVACKGGHNAESHNHNDVGSFIVYYDGEPLLLDAGVGAYTKKTFSGDRYKIWSMCSDYHNLPTVNGFTQSPGGQYCASDVDYSRDNHALSLNIAGAYPAEAGIEKLTRTVRLDGDKVRVSDQIALLNEGKAVFTLMCAMVPDLSSPGLLKFPNGTCIRYSDGLTAELDNFDVTAEDDSIRKSWGAITLTRVLLRSVRFKDAAFELTVERCDG